MKSVSPFLILILGVFVGCKIQNNEIVISGSIEGEIPKEIVYTSPINGTCNWNFTERVIPDSLGNFQINISAESPMFIKLRASYKQQGMLIVEPGKSYKVVLDVNQKEDAFSVAGDSKFMQNALSKLANPGHIQDGARAFIRDTVATSISEKIGRKKEKEIAVFQELLDAGTVSEAIFNLVKTDRECYYNAVQATTAWIKSLMAKQGRGKFNRDFERLWKESFEELLFSNEYYERSLWASFYAESYINFKGFEANAFSQEKMKARNEKGQLKTYMISKANDYLPANILENYIANYIFIESFQKKYEKELIQLFADFNETYPGSAYSKYIEPLIEPIVKFNEVAGGDFPEGVVIVENYENLNSLTDVAKTFGEGKIFVDVWATWCGPCKAEFEHKEKLAKLLKQQGVKMLYISIDRDDYHEQWKNMIKFYDLKGNHIRANKELDADLRKIFDRNGSISIPWYLILDGSGKVLVKGARRPSQIEALEKQLNSL